MSEEFGYIIIGWGAGDGPLTAHLAEAKPGYKVLQLEASGDESLDPNAVLDSSFRVRAVKALRVVDASVFPKIPGFFVVMPIYMIAEKAAEAILADAQRET